MMFHSSKELFGTSTEAKTKKVDETDDDNDDENEKDESNSKAPSLLEKAAEYEARRASTHPSANIQGDTSTGEEHEITKFQVFTRRLS
jgi:hypothetical protein